VPHAADLNDRTIEAAFPNLVSQSLQHIQGTGSPAACGGADKNYGPVPAPQCLPSLKRGTFDFPKGG
jgi:hypothetical protein